MRATDLNYQHLRYFYTVAREGSVLRASQVLHLAQSTVSGQIKTLEENLGQPLLERAGRALVVTPFGESVLRYAESIFELGDELVRVAMQGERRRPVRVGVSRVLPKLLVREILGPALMPDVQIVLEDGASETLLGELVARRLDVVLSDGEMPGWMAARGSSHLVIETDIAVFGTRQLAATVGDDLPHGLGRVPWLVPPHDTSLRHALDSWWDDIELMPDIAAVISDSALLKAVATTGAGIFAAPSRMRDAIVESYDLVCLGATNRITEQVWAITIDRDPTDEAVRLICRLDTPMLAEVR